MDYNEKTIRSTRIYKGRIISLREDTVKLSNGKEAKREIVDHPGAVAVVALTENNELVLVRQYRKPAERVLLEIPAGLMKEGEDEVDAARRELEEETGFRAKNIQKIVEGYSSPGYSSEVIKFYLAQGLVKTKQNPDEDELISVEIVPLKGLSALIKDGQIKDNKTFIGVSIARRIKDFL